MASPPRSSPYNLARLDLVSIRLVVDCVQQGSPRAAARQAHLALAAASRRVRELEDAMGEPLFERRLPAESSQEAKAPAPKRQ